GQVRKTGDIGSGMRVAAHDAGVDEVGAGCNDDRNSGCCVTCRARCVEPGYDEDLRSARHRVPDDRHDKRLLAVRIADVEGVVAILDVTELAHAGDEAIIERTCGHPITGAYQRDARHWRHRRLGARGRCRTKRREGSHRFASVHGASPVTLPASSWWR